MRKLIHRNSAKRPLFFSILGFCLLLSHAALGQTSIGQETAVITSDTTWTQANSPYLVTRDVEVRSQATLTIEPGVEIRFSATDDAATNNPSGVEILVRGRLLAQGTAESPILINGQDLAGPAEHATGIIFAPNALGSELSYVTINGLANGVHVQGDMSLSLSGLSIDAHKTALKRDSGASDLILSAATLIGGEYSADLAPLAENTFTRFVDCTIEGAIKLGNDGQGSLGFGSELTLERSSLTGSLMVDNHLQAGADLKILDSTISSGSISIEGDVNTGATLTVSGSSLTSTANMPALKVNGSILSDASISVSDSLFNGSIHLGPAPVLGGSGEGQYFFFDEATTWTAAAANCAALGGKLADTVNQAESQSIYNVAKNSSSGGAWIGATIVTPDCSAGDNYITIADRDECDSLRALGYPSQSVTTGKDCACSLSCRAVENVRSDCVPDNIQCRESVSYQSRLPLCDALAATGDPCFGDNLNWTWESGIALDQSAANWGSSEIDSLTCLSDSPNLTEALHVIIDTQDATGGNGGELGLWRAKSGDADQYGYVCEGRLAVPSAQNLSRGTINFDQVNVSGSVIVSAGMFNLTNSQISDKTTAALYRDAMLYQNSFQGTVSIASRERVEVSANLIEEFIKPNGTSAGGGVQVEAEHTIVYGNKIFGGARGVTTRGSANIANNLIAQMSAYGIRSFPDSETPSGLDNTIANNTLVENAIGISLEGTVNASTTRINNNNVVRGATIGMERISSAPLITNNNNVFDYQNLYSGFSPDGNSISASPNFVADFPAAAPIFRLDSGSPLIDLGRCDLAPNAPQSMGGLRVDIDGIPRPFDGDFDGNAGCDIGAFEFGPEEIFMYVDGALATPTSFSTGREVELTLWGRRDSNVFPVAPAVWNIDPNVGIFNEESDQFRPSATPGLYEGALHAQFGNLTTSLDVDLDCGCVAPDERDGSPGECNGVPECYFNDWTCPVRENYCQVAELGSFDNPLTVAAEDSLQIRAGARDIFGFVFKYNDSFTYEIINGGGSVTPGGMFTADSVAGDYVGSLRITAGNVTGVSDIQITPNLPAEIVITKATQSVSTTRTLLYSAVVKDAFDNVIPDVQVTWSIAAAGGSTIDPVSGRVTAGCAPGTYSNAVTATFGSVSRSSDLVVDQGGAIVTQLDISPASLSIPATTSDNFSVTVTDACGFTRPASNPVFSTNGTAGAIDQGGIFTAGCNLGSFNGAIVVSAENLQSSANVTVIDAPLRELSIQPNSAQVRMGSSQVFEAVGVDECGRLKMVEPLWSTPITNASVSGAGLPSNGQRLTVSCSTEGTSVAGLSAVYTDEFNRQFTAFSSISVLPGEVATLTLPQTDVSLPAGSEQQLQANAFDACGNPRQDAIRWSTSNGSIDATSGLLTAGCVRGLYPAAVFAQAGTQVGQINLEVTDGVLQSIEINPSPVSVQAGAQRQLTAQLYDGCNNLIEQEPTWRSTEGGSLTPTGLLTASESARTYFGAIIAELGGVQATADLIVTPAAASVLEVTPNPFVVAAGSVITLEVTAFDEFGNDFVPEVNWTVSPNAGQIDDDNQFTSGQVVGVYTDGLIARVGAAELAVDVEITAAAVSALNVQPTPVTVTANGSIQLNATPVDQFGNSVSNTPINWSVEAGGGQISATGLFTAFGTAGTFTQSILASGGGVEQRVDVVVTPSAATRLVITPSSIDLIPQQEQQIALMVFDANDNMIEPANVVYAVADGDGLFTVSPTGLVRALQNTGSGAVQINANGLSILAEVNIIPGPVTQIAITRPSQNEQVEVDDRVVVTPGEVLALNAFALDAFENEVDVPLTWSTSVENFGVTSAGVFTAGLVAGVYPNAIRVRHLGVERFITVEIQAGAPVSINIEPSTIIMSPGSSVQLNAFFTDAQGNVSDVEVAVNWGRIASSNFSITSDGIVSADCAVSPSFYADEITVATAAGTGLSLSSTANVDVRAGEVTSVEIIPNRADVEVDDDFFFVAEGMDACGFKTNDVAIYTVSNGRGSINSEGRFRASTVTEEVTVRASIGDLIADAQVTVTPGPAVDLNVIPDEVSVVVGQRQIFEVEASDEFGNTWTPNDAVWQVRDAEGNHGSTDEPSLSGPVGAVEQGELRAAEGTGTFLSEVKVSYQGQSAFADIYLVPDVPDAIEITPANPELIPNQIISFSANVSDQYGNAINNVEAVFSAPLGMAGNMTETGIFTAAQVVGYYPSSIVARLGDVVSQTDVTIVNSAPARIEIEPNTIRTTVDAVERFSATVYDTEGVEIANSTVEWSLNPMEIGQIIPDTDGVGRLAVGMNPGRYFAGVVAKITTSEGDVLQGTADIIIPRDFDEDGIDDTLEVQAMLDPRDPNDAELDPDQDGLSNAQEVNVGLDINDADCDNDGLADGAEEGWDTDTDGDGLVNALDFDSDGDGISDGVESGLERATLNDTSSDFIADADPVTTTNPLSVDSDGDGLEDGEEDANQNGRLDPGETPANSDLNIIACNASLEVTGCPDNLICLESVCSEPLPEAQPEPDDGCETQSGTKTPWLLVVCLGLIAIRRRQLA